MGQRRPHLPHALQAPQVDLRGGVSQTDRQHGGDKSDVSDRQRSDGVSDRQVVSQTDNWSGGENQTDNCSGGESQTGGVADGTL